MDINLNLTTEQISLLAEKLGYQAQVEDVTQPLNGDSYPLVDNPVSLEQFVEQETNQVLIEKVQDRLRKDIIVTINNIHNQAIERVSNGQYDNDLMTLDTSSVLQNIIGGLEQNV